MPSRNARFFESNDWLKKMFARGLNKTSGKRLHLPGQGWPLPTPRVLILIREVALQHLGFPGKLRGFTSACPCTVLEIADRHAMGPTWDRGGAALE
jgi:hypothetical protein